MHYNVIEIFTSEGVYWEGKPLYEAILEFIRSCKIAARCIVSRGIAGYYESGEIATQKILVLSTDMPLKIEIILPAGELETVLPTIERMVTDGIVVVEEMQIRSHRSRRRLIPRHLRVRDIMTRNPTSVSPDTSLIDVVRLLVDACYNGVPVVDADRKVMGIVTQGDLIERGGMPVRLGLLAHLEPTRLDEQLAPLEPLRVKQVMTHPAVAVQEDAYATQAVERMLKRDLKRLPVVDANGHLVGILARFDIFQTIARDAPDWRAMETYRVTTEDIRYVRDIVRTETPSVRPDTPIQEVIEHITGSRLQRIVVLDAERHLLGLITDTDLLRGFSDHPVGVWESLMGRLSFLEVGRRHRAFIEKVHATTAGEVMNRDVVSIQQDMPVDDAIRLMTDRQIKRLPVVDQENRFIGMITRAGVLRAGC